MSHRIDEQALECAASVFMSWLPNNNRPTSEQDRAATRAVLETYFASLQRMERDLARMLYGSPTATPCS